MSNKASAKDVAVNVKNAIVSDMQGEAKTQSEFQSKQEANGKSPTALRPHTPLAIGGGTGLPMPGGKSSTTIPVGQSAQKVQRVSMTAKKSAKLPPKLSLSMKFDEEELQSLFREFDNTHTGKLSLAKIDKVIAE